MSQHVDLRDGRIDFDDRGSGRPIVCVHGYLMGGDLWDEAADRLAARGFRVLTPTWPLGAHHAPLADGADRTPLGHARRIAGFLEALDLRDELVPGSRTFVMVDQPGRLAALVAEFLEAPVRPPT